MSFTPTPSLLSQIPATMRHAVLGSGDYQEICSNYVREHVQQRASMLVDRISKIDGMEDEMDKLRASPDFVEACSQNEVCLVEGEDGQWFHFQWDNLTTIPYNTDGQLGLDLAKFALDKGLQVQNWRWNSADQEVIHVNDITDDLDKGDIKENVLVAMAEGRYFDVGDVVQFLATVATHEGKTALAESLASGSQSESLFSDYVVKDSSLADDTFLGEMEAAENACDAYNIDASDYTPEVYEYWLIDERMAHWLKEAGEVVCEDFLDDLTVWGRCTTGQSIAMDGVISEIVNQQCDDEVEALVRKMYPHLDSLDENLEGVPLDMLKALEEKRVRVANYKYQHPRHESDSKSVQKVLVLAAEGPEGMFSPAWELADRGYGNYLGEGVKDDSNKGVPRPNSEIILSMSRYGAPFEKGEGVDVTFPDEALVAEIAEGIARYHKANKDAAMHKTPEHLQERLAAVSPAYAQALKEKDSGPSLG
jgi:hypothetical protein